MLPEFDHNTGCPPANPDLCRSRPPPSRSGERARPAGHAGDAPSRLPVRGFRDRAELAGHAGAPLTTASGGARSMSRSARGPGQRAYAATDEFYVAEATWARPACRPLPRPRPERPRDRPALRRHPDVPRRPDVGRTLPLRPRLACCARSAPTRPRRWPDCCTASAPEDGLQLPGGSERVATARRRAASPASPPSRGGSFTGEVELFPLGTDKHGQRRATGTQAGQMITVKDTFT